MITDRFTSRDEIILVEYEEIIRSPYPLLLTAIQDQYNEIYKSYLWTEMFEEMNIPNLERLCIQRSDIDLFKFLAKTEFDTKSALKDLKDKFFTIYEDAPLLPMGDSLIRLMLQKYARKIYIYSEIYDVRIHKDIQTTFQDMQRVPYVTGDFREVIEAIPDISCYILRDIDNVKAVLDTGRTDFTEIMLGKFGFNYKETDTDVELKIDMKPYHDKHTFKFGVFMPQELTEDHFTHLIEG